jgi:hypothetical protein
VEPDQSIERLKRWRAIERGELVLPDSSDARPQRREQPALSRRELGVTYELGDPMVPIGVFALVNMGVVLVAAVLGVRGAALASEVVVHVLIVLVIAMSALGRPHQAAVTREGLLLTGSGSTRLVPVAEITGLLVETEPGTYRTLTGIRLEYRGGHIDLPGRPEILAHLRATYPGVQVRRGASSYDG